jgi:hypothetical protein
MYMLTNDRLKRIDENLSDLTGQIGGMERDAERAKERLVGVSQLVEAAERADKQKVLTVLDAIKKSPDAGNILVAFGRQGDELAEISRALREGAFGPVQVIESTDNLRTKYAFTTSEDGFILSGAGQGTIYARNVKVDGVLRHRFEGTQLSGSTLVCPIEKGRRVEVEIVKDNGNFETPVNVHVHWIPIKFKLSEQAGAPVATSGAAPAHP